MHGPGWTLVTVRPQFISSATGTRAENVLHYYAAGADPTTPTTDAILAAADTYWSAGIAPIMNTSWAWVGTYVHMDNGLTIVDGHSEGTINGSDASGAATEVLTAIVRKRAEGRGRRRFGHLCHVGVPSSMLLDPNYLNTAALGRLNDFYRPLIDLPGFVAAGLETMCLFNNVLDEWRPVLTMGADRQIKTCRRRLPGRGM